MTEMDPIKQMMNWKMKLHSMINQTFPKMRAKWKVKKMILKKSSILLRNKLKINKIILENQCHNCSKSFMKTKKHKSINMECHTAVTDGSDASISIHAPHPMYKCQHCKVDENKLGKHIDNLQEAERELMDVEDQVVKEIEEENKEKFREFQESYKGSSAYAINQKSMWKMFNKIGPQKKATSNCAIKNHKGKTIYRTNEKLAAMSIEYTNRLRRRPVMPGYETIRELDNKLFEKKIKAAAATKSEDVTEEELDKALNKLKVKKSRDADDLQNILFMPQNIGRDLKKSLLQLINTIKNAGIVPP